MISMLVAMTSFSINSFATDTLSYWETDNTKGYTIGYWESAPTIKVVFQNSNFTNFTSMFTSGVSKWGAAGMSFTYYPSSNPNSVNIKVYAGTEEEIENKTDIVYQSDWLGDTLTSGSTSGKYFYGSHKISRISYTDAFLTVKMCSTLTGNATKLSNVCTHELGHALGWRGHCYDTSETNIMRPSSSLTTTLSSKDKRHITQLYN